MSTLYPSVVQQAGSDARTHAVAAAERLQKKFPASIPSDELLAYLLPQHLLGNRDHVSLLKTFLRVNPKIEYDPKANTYRFKPLHNIASADDLLSFLQRQETALGISVRELKDGWPDAEEAIDQLEAKHKLLVTRNKKDNHPRMVWANDPTLVAPLDAEFKEIWSGVSLPLEEDVIRELKKMNYTPTGQIAEQTTAPKVEKKKRKVRRGAKVTNLHMQGLFKDYSSHRPQAGK